jgi:hypothetical protein
MIRAALLVVIACALSCAAPSPPPSRSPARAVELPRIAGKTSMNLSLSLAPFPIDNLVSILWIQILHADGGPILISSVASRQYVGSLSILSSVPIRGSGPPTQVLANRQMLPVALRWDAARRADGKIVAVFERALGGTNAVMFQGPDEMPPVDPKEVLRWTQQDWVREGPRLEAMMAREWVSPRESRDHFTGPRFVRGLGERLAVTAIANFQGGPVLFRGVDAPAGSAALPALPIAVQCTDAIMVVDRNGPALVYKTFRKGPSDDNEIVPGRLRYVRLSDDLAPVGASATIFPDTTVHQFDVAPLADGIAVAATTPTGLVIAVGASTPRGFEVFGQKAEAIEGHLASPSILGSGSTIHVAALVDPTMQKARLLVGTVGMGP